MLLYRPSTGELLPADILTSREFERLLRRWRRSLALALAKAGAAEAAFFILRLSRR